MQPLARLTVVWVWLTISWLSMLMAPKSLTITAMRRPWSLVRMRISKVVLPAPRKPDTRVTGIGASLLMVRASEDVRQIEAPGGGMGSTVYLAVTVPGDLAF